MKVAKAATEYAEPTPSHPRTASQKANVDNAQPTQTPPVSDLSRPRQLLTLEQLSELLQVPRQTVYRWRAHGSGPRGFRVGKHVRYDIADVMRWLDSRRDA
jgi:excisionase family DNA binding protein